MGEAVGPARASLGVAITPSAILEFNHFLGFNILSELAPGFEHPFRVRPERHEICAAGEQREASIQSRVLVCPSHSLQFQNSIHSWVLTAHMWIAIRQQFMYVTYTLLA